MRQSELIFINTSLGYKPFYGMNILIFFYYVLLTENFIKIIKVRAKYLQVRDWAKEIFLRNQFSVNSIALQEDSTINMKLLAGEFVLSGTYSRVNSIKFNNQKSCV